MKQVLLLHGALASRHQFDNLLPLIRNEINAEAINFTGHGGLNIPTHGYTFQQFEKDILKYADDHSIEKLNIFGFSMGGYAALFFASKHPDRVEKIHTLNVKFNWDPTSTAKETAMLDAEKMIQKVPGYANQLMMQHGLNMWKEVLNKTSEMMTSLSKDLVLTNEDFERIQIPVRLAIGDKDFTSSVEETTQIYRKLKHGQLWVLPDTSHPFEKVSHQAVAESIRSFF